MRNFYKIIFLFFAAGGLLWHQDAHAQIKIRGAVYDITRTIPLSGVSVMSTSGIGTATDSNGNYMIIVPEGDSIWFSYLNKATPKFAVSTIINPNGFDIALHVPVTELREVRVMPKNYRLDSIQNRRDYAKAFDFRKPGLKLNAPASGQFGVGVDLDELINVFRFQRNKRMLAFQQRLVQEEQDKSIDHRFTKALVKKITHAEGDKLDDFMKRYRPSFEFISVATDYELAEYIKLAWQQYLARY